MSQLLTATPPDEAAALVPADKPTPHAPTDNEAPPRRPSVVRLLVLLGLAAAVFAGLGAAGVQARNRRTAAREGESPAPATTRPKVLVVRAEAAPARTEQVLPGSAAPLLETALYARTTGYLRRRLVDIGDRVAEGQLLAEIESPEVDAQLLQSRAVLGEARATVERNRASEAVAKLTLNRVRRLGGSSAVSQQEVDDAAAGLEVAAATTHVGEAAVTAGEASVRRLEDLQRFQRVTAPFAGVVTARNYDPGALVVADTATSRELFHVARVDTLRVFADVPQAFAASVRAGQAAPVFRREAPGKDYPGAVARTTGAVDPQTRTLRVQVDVPNPDGALLPGMYLQVRFRLDAPGGVVRVPGAAVITRADGAKVAVVDAGGSVRYRPVQLGRDFGQTVEVVGGLAGGESVVIRPGDDLPDGTAVEPVASGSP